VIRLDVWLTDASGTHHRVGDLAFTDADQHGRYRSAFRYSDNWLAATDSRFPLDPANLPLSSDEYQTDRLEPPLMVFSDALPDDWGRRLLVIPPENHRLQK
jgi:serine/threonine-protein kinase HipA